MESSSAYSQVQVLSTTPDIPVAKYPLITIGVSEGQSSEELLTETLPTDFPLQFTAALLLSLDFPKEEPFFSPTWSEITEIDEILGVDRQFLSIPFFSDRLSDVENFSKGDGQVSRCHYCPSDTKGGRTEQSVLVILKALTKLTASLGCLEGGGLMLKTWKWTCCYFPLAAVHGPCCDHGQPPMRLLFSKVWQKPDAVGQPYDVVSKKICSITVP